MEIFVKEGNLEHWFAVSNVQAYHNLTFCCINNDERLYATLLKLVKNKVLYSFEPKEDIIKLTIYTEFVDLIM